MKELVSKINEQMEAFKSNAEAQLEKGNKSAGARARKASLELERMFKQFRKLSIHGGE